MSAEPWTGPLYLDASALVKLIVSEPESDALNEALAAPPTSSSPTSR